MMMMLMMNPTTYYNEGTRPDALGREELKEEVAGGEAEEDSDEEGGLVEHDEEHHQVGQQHVHAEEQGLQLTGRQVGWEQIRPRPTGLLACMPPHSCSTYVRMRTSRKMGRASQRSLARAGRCLRSHARAYRAP